MRTIQTVPRIGQEMPETVLQFDPASRSLSLGARKDEADVQAAEDAILEYLKSVSEPKTEPEIDEAVEGQTRPKRKALPHSWGKGKSSGKAVGKKAIHPNTFSRFLVPRIREQETASKAEASENQHDREKKACSRDPETASLVPEDLREAKVAPGCSEFSPEKRPCEGGRAGTEEEL